MKPPFNLIHEDDDVLVIDKPAGLLTSTVPNERRPTLLAIVTEYLSRTSPQARIGLIHRLDRDASGLLVFSKCPPAFYSLKQQFFKHTVSRIYFTIVRGKLNPPAGRIESRLVEYADGSVHSTRRRDAGQIAITHYKTIDQHGDCTLLRVQLETGRKHQIRAHLSERNAPIVNDPVYAKEKANGRMMLAAIELAFDHPRTGERKSFSTKLPPEMAAMLRK